MPRGCGGLGRASVVFVLRRRENLERVVETHLRFQYRETLRDSGRLIEQIAFGSKFTLQVFPLHCHGVMKAMLTKLDKIRVIDLDLKKEVSARLSEPRWDNLIAHRNLAIQKSVHEEAELGRKLPDVVIPDEVANGGARPDGMTVHAAFTLCLECPPYRLTKVEQTPGLM